MRELLLTGSCYIYKATSVKDQFSDRSYLSHRSNWTIWTTTTLFMSEETISEAIAEH